MVFVYVVIENAGTGNDSSIGLVSGYLQWVSAAVTGAPTYKPGIFDERSIAGLGAICNITNGGTFGGFSGDVDISAVSPELVAAVTSGAVKLVGKRLKVSLGFDDLGTRINYYVGSVTDWAIEDEITISIKSSPVFEMDKAVVKSVTITPEMALNNPRSSAVGKSVVPSYGRKCVFPMTHIPSDSDLLCALSTSNRFNDSDALVVDVQRIVDRFDAGIGQSVLTGKMLGHQSFFVLDIWQETENVTDIWMVLSVNGREFFTSNIIPYVDDLRKVLLGRELLCVAGTGKGASFNITDVQWAKYGGDSYSHLWIRTNNKDISKVKETAFDETAVSYLSSSGVRYIKGSSITTGAGAPGEFVGSIKSDGELTPFGRLAESDVSVLRIKAAANVYAVSSYASLAEQSVSLIGYSDGVKYSAPINTSDIATLYETPLCRVISIPTEIGDLTITAEQVITYFTGNLFYSAFAVNGSVEPAFADSALVVAQTYSRNFTTISQAVLELSMQFNIPVLDSVDLTTSGPSSFIPDIRMTLTGPTGFDHAGLLLTMSVANQEGFVLMSKNWRSGNFTSTASEFGINTEARTVNGSDVIWNSLMSEFDISHLSGEGFTAGHILINVFFEGVTNVSPPEGWPSVFTATARPASRYSTKSLSADSVFLEALSVGASAATVATPASLFKYIATTHGLSVDSSEHASVNTLMAGLYSEAGTYDGQYTPEARQQISDVLTNICRASMLAAYAKRDGVIGMAWFADDYPYRVDSSVFTFDGSNIIKGSLRISKTNCGYRSTDYTFQVKRQFGSPTENVSINTDQNLASFPTESETLRSGTKYGHTTSAHEIWLDDRDVLYYPYAYVLRVNATGPGPNLHQLFRTGTRWIITKPSGGEFTAVLTSVSLDYLPISGMPGVYLGFTPDGAYTAEAGYHHIQAYGPNPAWRSSVSGSFDIDYLVAKNIWEHAQEARTEIGVERKASSEVTGSENPIWGSDSRALMQWMAYTTLHGTREKTLIKVRAPLNELTAALWVMDIVSVAYGPYALSPTVGRIVEIMPELGENSASVEFSILTFTPDQELFLNENFAQADLIIDETDQSAINYDEGGLA